MLKIGYDEGNLKILEENLDEIKMIHYIWGNKIVAYWRGDKIFEKPLWLAGFKGMEGTTALRRVQSIVGRKFIKAKDGSGLLVNKKEFEHCWVSSHLVKDWDWRQGYVSKVRYRIGVSFKDGSIFINDHDLSKEASEEYSKALVDFETKRNEKDKGKNM